MIKIEVISRKSSNNWIFGKKWPFFFYTFWPKNPPFWIFPRVPLLTHASRHLGEDFRKFSAKTNEKKLKLLVNNLQKLDLWKKWRFFDTFWPKNSQFWIFPWVPLLTHASRHLGEDFQPKIMTKMELMSQNLQKNWILGKNGHFLTVFGQKSQIFQFFHE